MSNYKEKFSLKTAIFILIAISTVAFFSSIFFVVSTNNYYNIQSLYLGVLMAALLRNIALLCVLTAVWLYIASWVKTKVEIMEQKYLVIFFVVIFSVALILSTAPIVEDLVVRNPVEINGTIAAKSEVQLPKGSVEYHIRIDTIKEDFLMVGDNSRNGFDNVRIGDNVKIFYGSHTKKVFLIRRNKQL